MWINVIQCESIQYESRWINMNQCNQCNHYCNVLEAVFTPLCTPLLMRMAQAERMRPPEPVAGVRALPMLVMCRIETCQTMPKYAKIARNMWISESPFEKLLRGPSILLMFYDFLGRARRMRMKWPENHAEDLLRTVGKKKQAPSHGLRYLRILRHVYPIEFYL
jgi:hypothetical protein